MRFVVAVAAALASTSAPAVAASPTVRLAIVHFVSGCHVWSLTNKPSATLTVKAGTRVVIRPNCPMDFDFAQTAGPKLALGDPRTYAGTVRTIVFRKPGVYRLVVHNVQTSTEQGLQTLGADNTLTLTVRVR
jgi:hypothetical protein